MAFTKQIDDKDEQNIETDEEHEINRTFCNPSQSDDFYISTESAKMIKCGTFNFKSKNIPVRLC